MHEKGDFPDMCRLPVCILLCTFIAMLIPWVIIPDASAASISISPDHISPGSEVWVSIQGLENGSIFNLTIQGTYDVTTDSDLDFQANNFSMPFTLSGGNIKVGVTNAAWVMFSVRKGTSELSLEAFPRNGTFGTVEAQSVPAGEYDYLRLQVTPFTRGKPVSTFMQLSGAKSGPDNAEIHFNIEGVHDATVLVGTAVDGEELVNHQIIVGDHRGNTSPALPATHLVALLVFLCILYGLSHIYRVKP